MMMQRSVDNSEMPAQVFMSPYWSCEVNPQVDGDFLDELIYLWPYSRRLMSPLPEGEEEDEDSSEAELKEVSGPSKDVITPFDWSAASARIDKILPTESEESPRLPGMTTVILSQEILTPRMETTDTYHKDANSLPKGSIESVVEKPVTSSLRCDTVVVHFLA
ncbi:unnamed protein product [Hydatigera taeniaeformis]|uniref:LBH domain-containing protein n=1 Tax=Hydatigena taeniaeformis TaxID=6205 RepID=A0A0R3XCE0_HYDTA|nr:unnamed protein product [Hydatigera taeniaeformis]